MASPYDMEDKEKGYPGHGVYGSSSPEELHRFRTADSERDPDSALANRFGSVGPLLSKVFASGVEARGVERVPEDQRGNKHAWNNLLMWW